MYSNGISCYLQDLYVLYGIIVHSITFYCTVQYSTKFSFIWLHSTVLCSSILYLIVLYYSTQVYFTVMGDTTLYLNVLHCNAFYCTLVLFTKFYFPVLFSTPLYYTLMSLHQNVSHLQSRRLQGWQEVHVHRTWLQGWCHNNYSFKHLTCSSISTPL